MSPSDTNTTGLTGEKWGLNVLLEGLPAKYDWLSCAVRINATEFDWQRLHSGQDADIRSQELSEQITHEVFHFFQTLTSSYLYRFSLRLWWIAAPEIRAVLAGTQPSEETIHKMVSLYRSLDDPGRFGFTPRHIIEAGAFQAQKVFNWTNAPVRYHSDLYPVGKTYRGVFDHLFSLLGDVVQAFASIPLLTSLALRHDHPGDAFMQIAASWVEQLRMGKRHIAWEKLLGDTDVSHLGDLVDVEQAEEISHPVLREPAAQFSQLVDLYKFYETPEKSMSVEIAESLLPAIVLNSRVQGGRWSNDLKVLVAIAEVSGRLLRFSGLA